MKKNQHCPTCSDELNRAIIIKALKALENGLSGFKEEDESEEISQMSGPRN